MLTIVGRVTVEGSGVAVGDVVVEAFDVTRDTTHTGPLTASDISWVGSEPSLGSAITASDGTFTLTASGLTSYPVRTAVAVFGATGAAAELIQLVTRTRLLNDGTHHYAVEVPADGATRTGPVGGAAALAAAAEQRVTAAKNLRKAASALRSADVDTARKRIAADDPKVIEGLVDLAIAPTKNSRGEPSPNIVPLGKKVAEHIRDLLRGALDSAANTATVRALVDVSDDVRPSLFDADGQPIDVAGELNIRTALFGPAFADGIPSRHRRDPLDVACRLRRSPYLDCGDTAKPGHDAGGGPDDGPGPGDGAGPDDGTGNGDEAGLERIRAMTLDLLDDTTELATATAALAEPATAQTIGQDLAELRLSGGPAEDIAMFDFERLYLAAELAVLPDVDDGLVYEVSDSIRVVAELGGNVADPSHDKEDVLTAVSSETRAVREAAPQRPPQQPTMVPRTGEPLGYRKYFGRRAEGDVGGQPKHELGRLRRWRYRGSLLRPGRLPQ